MAKPLQTEKKKVASPPLSGSDRRVSDRYSLGAASGTLVYKGEKNSCEILDISLDGCLIRLRGNFLDGALAYVEVVLHLFGMVLHIGGITQWVRQGNLIGLRFIHPTARAKNELAGLLTCLVDREAAPEIQKALALARFDPRSTHVLAVEKPEVPAAQLVATESEAAPQKEAIPEEPFDWMAGMYFPELQKQLRGTILGIHMEGCVFELEESFAGRHPAQVEVEFTMRGLPLRLGGNTAPTKDKRIINIIFDEASTRRHRQLAELVQEIQEAQHRIVPDEGLED